MVSEVQVSMEAERLERIRALAEGVRSFLEPRWMEWRVGRGHPPLEEGKAASWDMCRFSTSFLHHVLEREMPEEDWIILGGSPDDDQDIDRNVGLPGGYHDRSTDQWHGHYWITDGAYDLVVDVTADQFDGPAVLVVSESGDEAWGHEVAGQYAENYLEAAVEHHMRDLLAGTDAIHALEPFHPKDPASSSILNQSGL
jgi:hypothetical protein